MSSKEIHLFAPHLNKENEKLQLKRLKKKLKGLNLELRLIQRQLSNQDFIEKTTENTIKEVRKKGKGLKAQMQEIKKLVSVFVI